MGVQIPLNCLPFAYVAAPSADASKKPWLWGCNPEISLTHTHTKIKNQGNKNHKTRSRLTSRILLPKDWRRNMRKGKEKMILL